MSRRERRQARRLVLKKLIEAKRAAPDKDPEELVAAVAEDLRADSAGFDIALLLELLTVLLPLILDLFDR